VSAIVVKFGGTSVATPSRVRAAARRIRGHVKAGRRVVVVVSAAGSSTDRILDWVTRVGAPPVVPRIVPLDGGAARSREVDRALATGEDRSASLLAVALWSLGVPARSLRGGEAGIQVDGGFGGGRIVRVDATPVHRMLDAGVVPIVSGYQGQRSDGETLTLGRGGSDISAVAVAAALGAACHIVTDVDAVYDRDPRGDPAATPFSQLDHAALIRLTEAGAHVVHPLAARLAAEARVPLRIYHHGAPLAGGGTRIDTRTHTTAAGGAA
jgi:aspartate kinase